MKKFPFKDLFILNKIKNKILKGIFLFGISSFSFGQINLAFIDTGYCPKEFETNSKIAIQQVFDATSKINQDYCREYKINRELPRFHGQHVIDHFLKEYSGRENIQIYPIVVFDNLGEQKKEYWARALKFISDKKINVVISASGLKMDAVDLNLNSNVIWLLSTPHLSPYIKMTDLIFPQSLSNGVNIFLFGNLVKENMIDPGLLYPDKTHLYVIDSKEKFNGSSFALSIIAPKMLSRCNNTEIKIFQKCFYENRIKNGDIYLWK